MRGPYGFEMSENCQSCTLRKASFFCNLTPQALKDFEALKSTSAYPEGAILFLEKQGPRGIFVLCEGEVKLTISSSEGRTLILRIAKPGEILGLTAAISGNSYEVTAETIRPSQIAFVRRDDFLKFAAQYPEACHGVVKQLSSNYRGACEQLRTVGLSSSAPEKLARLLLEWSADAEHSKPGSQITMRLTHEEIADFIGSTRETVTRTLSDFRSRRLVTLKGSTLSIPSREALEQFVST